MDSKAMLTEYMTDPKFVAKVWSKVKKTETCWIYDCPLDGGKGYPRISRMYYTYRVTRVIWFIVHHVDPHPLFVLHTCDNPACVNPDHLYLGSHKQNCMDMIDKGRAPNLFAPGAKNILANLTDEQVKIIKQRLLSGDRVTDIANDYGVSHVIISNIGNGKTWKYVTL